MSAGVVWGVIGFFSVSGPPKTTVNGVFKLTDSNSAQAHCVGQGAYGDIREGTSVTLIGDSAQNLGSARLSLGSDDSTHGICIFRFSFPNVPQNQSEYAVQIGHGDPVVSSYVELQQQQWTFFMVEGS